MSDDTRHKTVPHHALEHVSGAYVLHAPRSRAEWRVAAILLADAFHEDPFNRALMPDPAARRRVFLLVYRMLLRFFRVDGTILLLSARSDARVSSTPGGPAATGHVPAAGVIVFRVEGEHMSAGERLARLPRRVAAFTCALALPVRMLFIGHIGGLLRRSRTLRASYGKLREAYRPFENRPYLSLELIAVRSDLRGNGLMGRMMGPMLEEADRKSLTVVLNTETPENLPIYAHYGFEPVDSVEAVPGALTYHVLARRPGAGR